MENNSKTKLELTIKTSDCLLPPMSNFQDKAKLTAVHVLPQQSPPPSPPLGWSSTFETVHSKGGFYDEATNQFLSFQQTTNYHYDRHPRLDSVPSLDLNVSINSHFIRSSYLDNNDHDGDAESTRKLSKISQKQQKISIENNRVTIKLTDTLPCIVIDQHDSKADSSF